MQKQHKITNNNTKKGKKMANNKNHRSSQVLMKTPSGYEHMFESITAAANFAKANSWTMALKMQVKGYFEDAQGNKYYRQDEMITKNQYTTTSAKMTKKVKPKQKRKKPIRVDGKLFNSIAEASRFYHFNPDIVAQYLKAGKNKYKGYHIEYSNMNEIQELMNTNKMPKKIDIEPKVEIKDENISVIIDSTDPAIKAINDRIVELLKKSGVYEEIKKLSQAIQKLSK